MNMLTYTSLLLFYICWYTFQIITSLYFSFLIIRAMFVCFLCLFPLNVLVFPHIHTSCITIVPTESDKYVGK